MGRGIRHSKNKKNKNRGDRPQKERQDNGVGYKELVRESSLFESFYKAQIEVCPPEEFDQMFDYLKRDLPASFRVTGFRSQVSFILLKLSLPVVLLDHKFVQDATGYVLYCHHEGWFQDVLNSKLIVP